MQKIFLSIGILLILLGIFGTSYTWHYDHRTAETLDDYAKLDFQVSRTEDGDLEGASLSLYDYRYDKTQLLKRAILYTDGAPWEVPAFTKQTPQTWQNENKLFVALPASSLRDILLAKEVRLRYYYENGQTIDLPLSNRELLAWQRKLRW